ncbi:DUF2637 domain-containing protein [uncultured Microbacterium sp.]|uniref:DUF2637 domain-containing protein n=1 Tax=uncultured Microbacterium sp. TaxID=191216 RepID=UPI0026378D8B|nr:DUF2637 domain-containing protein [uncultured Microbacterium sp.]
MPRKAGFLGDSRALSVTAIVLAVVVAAALFVVSYQGLAHAAEAIGLHSTPWVVPLAIDGGILVAGLLAAVKRGQRRKATLELTILWSATLASSGANYLAHAERGDGVLAIVVATAAPVFFLAITESIIRTIIQDEAPERKPRRKRIQTAVTEPAVASVPAAATPATKLAPKCDSRPVSAAVSLESLTPEVAAMVEEFRAVAHDPASSEGGAVSDRMSALLLSLVDDHDVRAVDLSRIAGHADAARLRARLKKARDQQKNLVSV